MKEWILENTEVTEEKYVHLINPNTLDLEDNNSENTNSQLENNSTKNKLFEHPILVINNFTYKQNYFLKKSKYKVTKTKDFYIYKEIKFRILSDLLKDMKKTLLSTKRKGKCFELSIDILMKHFNTNIITAMCINPLYKEPLPFLHGIILSKDTNGKEIILDTTFNTIIDKEVYLKLLQANIISCISRDEFIDDTTLIRKAKIDKYISLVEYLCFRDQIIKTTKRLLKNSRK